MTLRELMLSEKLRKTLNLPEIINIADQLPRHAYKKWPKRDFSALQGNIIHHAASEAPIRNQALYHVNSHGWPGIAYTWCIQNDKIYQTNWLDDRTTHASGANDNAWGICVVGDLSKRSITDFERRAITGLVLMTKEKFPHLWTKGHNQVTKTACPCTDMDRIRADIEDVEESLSYHVSTAAERALVFSLANRIKDLSAKLKSPQWGAEARRKLNKLNPIAKELGLTDLTAESISKAILDQYAASVKADFSDGGFTHLLAVGQYAKSVGIIS